VSKTFKALQRAARERAAKKGGGEPMAPVPDQDAMPEPHGLSEPGGLKALAPDRAESGTWPLARPEGPLPRPSEMSPVLPAPIPIMPGNPGPELRGDGDPVLQDLLKETFVGGMGLVRVEKDGWVRGRLDIATARHLLDRYALLHCLRQDEANSLWFWSSTRAAQDRARRSGLALDLEDVAEP